MKNAVSELAVMGVCLTLLSIGIVRDVDAQGGQVFTYPRDGQSRDQHDRDRLECSRFAIENTGFDPQFEAQFLARSQSQLHSTVTSPPPNANRGGLLRGGAVGSAAGAIAGGIAGNAGRGAQMGAATGAFLGAGRRANARADKAQWDRQQAALRQQESQQLQAEFDAGMAGYERAFSVCMRGRNYEVM